jgi:hypothetical protein
MSLSYSGNVSLIRITKSIEYNTEEDEYLVTSFKTGEKYEVFRLNKIWICTCKSFLYNKERDSKGCKHTQRVKIVDNLRRIGSINSNYKS